MAENAANFTTTYQAKPSIFEIIAQNSLDSTLYPAFQKVALFLSSSFPKKFGFLNFYYDEAFATVNAVLQYYYLRYYDASFSENFYGLKRVLLNEKPLTKHDKELSLLLLVAVPYFKRKIEEKLQIYRIEQAEGCLRKDFEGIRKKFLIYSHSTFEVLWHLWILNNYLCYMGEKTDIQLPILRLLNLKLVYSNEESSQSFWSALFKGNLNISNLSFGLVRNGISAILETSAFFLQFLQAWNVHKPNYNITDLPKVDAPCCDNKANTFQGKCPICLQSWLIPTVLPTSGYIFCFKCISKYLQEKKKCPVTNLPARLQDVVRIYGDS